MILLSLFFAMFIVAGTKGQFSDDTNDDTALPKAPLNIVASCYSSVEITKGLCATDEDCADDSERCYTQVCVAKHTVEKTRIGKELSTQLLNNGHLSTNLTRCHSWTYAHLSARQDVISRDT